MNENQDEIIKVRQDFAADCAQIDGADKAISADEISNELKIILRDYFVGNVSQNAGSIQIKFLNGQKFNITVEQCV